jgi:hypothetical protein
MVLRFLRNSGSGVSATGAIIAIAAFAAPAIDEERTSAPTRSMSAKGPEADWLQA